MDAQMGKWAFLIGFVVAVLGGLLAGFNVTVLSAGVIAAILLILGLVVGLVNVTTHEVNDFLLAAIALSVVGAAGFTALGALIGSLAQAILQNIFTFVAPAALVVALKGIVQIGRKA